MSVVVHLEKITSASKEAYFSWEITLPSGVSFKKGALCLTDIEQDGDDDSAIQKYQLHSTESPAGSHIFEGLHVGDYYARLTIIGSDDSINVSDLLTVTVYDLGAAEIDSVSPLNSSFSITLFPYDGVLQEAHGLETAQEIETVNFVLFGRPTDAYGFVPGSKNLNIIKAKRNDNTYTLSAADGIENSWKYEIACFYTDNKGVSGDISNTKVATPTNRPNKIKNVEAIYDYSNKKLIIKYTNPDDITQWTPKTVRATLTYGSTVQTYNFNASSNSGTVVQGQQLVFNESSSPLLTPDTRFTLTLAMEDTVYGYSDFESDAITCIVPSRFCSEPTAISNVQYIVGDGTFSVTYVKADLDKYNVKVRMVVTYYDSFEPVYENDDYESGFAVGVENGEYYNVNLQVFYSDKDDGSIVFGPCSADIEHHDKTFIPHGQSDAPSNLQVSYGDGSAELSWDEPDSFHGYILDHYELSTNGGSTWPILRGTNTNYLVLCDDGYTSGQHFTFLVRAVTKSPDANVYPGTERTDGSSSSVDVYPLRKPQSPIIDSQVPGDSQCEVTFHDGTLYDGVKQHYNYTINNASPQQISSSSTSYTFTGLTNNVTSTIGISVVTKSGPDNVQESDQVEFETKPFKMPDVPTLSAKPWTESVDLTWSANNPETILDQLVEYAVEYKLVGASTWNTSNSSVTSPLTISGLTSNSEYNFRIRSKIYNVENDETLYSEYSDSITSRPFVYSKPPTMNIVAGNRTITVTITPPVSPNNNYYGPHAYHASVDLDPDTNGSDVIYKNTSSTSTIIFTFDNSGLVNLDNYKVVAWYDMVSPGITDPYTSNTVSNSVTPFDPAVAPPLFSDPDDGQITLSWDDGNMYGLTITGYQVSSKLYADSEWSAWSDPPLTLSDCHGIPSDTQNINDYYIVRNHANGTKMSYKIRAVILNAGTTYYSAESSEAVATPYTNADAPTLVSYVSSSNQITLNWAEPSNLGGLPLDHYNVSKDSINWDLVYNSTSKVFDNLTNGTPYTFYVKAVTNNRDNVSQASNLDTVNENISTNILEQDATPYDVPTITLNSVVSGDEQLTLNWEEPYLGGHDFDHYEIYYNDVKYGETVSTDLHYPLTNLSNGTPYACAVKIYVKDENDNAAEEVFSVTSNNKTNIPYVAAIAPSVTSVPSDEYVTLSWVDLTSEELGGLPLKRYEVKKEGDSVWDLPNGNFSHTFNELNNGTEYTFYVRAVTTNEYYESDPAITTDEVIGVEKSTNDIPYLPLDGPSILTCVPGNTVATLTWEAPELVGLTLLRYEVSGGTLSEPVTVGTSTQYVFTGLSNNTRYSFYVKAVANHKYVGEITGPDSEASKIPYAIPEPVTNLRCTAVNGDLTVFFDDPDPNNDPDTSSVNNGLEQDYKIKLVRDDESIDDIDYNDLTNGQTIPIPTDTTETIQVYVYSRIRDPNNNDNNTNSVYSPYTNINVVNSNLLSDIQNLTATSGDQQITLKWENINTNSGSTYAIVRIKEDGSFELILSNVTTTTAIITTLSDGSPLVNGTLYRFNVYASQDDMLQITATPIGPPIINSASNSGSNFYTNVNFNGDTKVSITIIAITSDSVEIVGPASYTSTVNTITGGSSSYLKYVVIVSNSIGSVKYVSA